MRFSVFLFLVLVAPKPVNSEPSRFDFSFKEDVVGNPPRGWVSFNDETSPRVRVHELSSGKKCLIGQRSGSSGLTALSYQLASPAQRVLIEFRFAFSKSQGRTLNIWSHDPTVKDASQLNLCIQNGALQQFDQRTQSWEEISREIVPSHSVSQPIWHRLRILFDARERGLDYWLAGPEDDVLSTKPIATMHTYRTCAPIQGIDLVSGTRIAKSSWYLIDDLKIITDESLPTPGTPTPLPEEYEIWTGAEIPEDVNEIPLVPGIVHRTIHEANDENDHFLHGAAIIEHHGTIYANWANSPTNENGPQETLRGRRSLDGGHTWLPLEVIAPGFKGLERHSHGVYLKHNNQLWTICSRFGVGDSGRHFDGLGAEAFRLDEATGKWVSQGMSMQNCWPYDEPVRLQNGNWVTGGQDRNGHPVVAVSDGANPTSWKTHHIPFPKSLAPGFAETTVWGKNRKVFAVIRGGGGHAWISTSENFGESWSNARPSNLPMPRAKAYLGRLSTGQLFLVSNLINRDHLVISVSKPGEVTFEKMWRIRSGKSGPPRYPGKAKGKQWSYPYASEIDGKLFVVYSIGKEDCGLSILPLDSLAIENSGSLSP